MELFTNHRDNFPHYGKYLDLYLKGEYKILAKSLKERNLSVEEKILLECRLLIKNKSVKEANDKLLFHIKTSNPFFLAEKYFLLGQCEANYGNWQQAYIYNLEAIKFYQVIRDKRGLFLAHYNSSVDSERLMNLKIADYHLNESLQYFQSLSQRILILRAKAALASKSGHKNQALNLVKEALELSNEVELSPIDSANLKILAQEIYIQFEEQHLALEILKDLIKQKNSPDKARIYFNWYLLKKNKKNQSLGAPSVAIKQAPEYLLKWNTLRYLQSGQENLAKKCWDELKKLFPLRYGNNFTLMENYDCHSLFGITLKKYLNLTQPKIASINLNKKISGKLQDLEKILMSAKHPLRKEEIIEKVWDIKYDSAFDSRFYKLVERYRHTGQHRLLNQHFTYRLI